MRAPELDEQEVLARTTECLTVPYDHTLVNCVNSGGVPELCLRAFAARRGDDSVLRPRQQPEYEPEP
jgi:hypothetical protein